MGFAFGAFIGEGTEAQGGDFDAVGEGEFEVFGVHFGCCMKGFLVILFVVEKVR